MQSLPKRASSQSITEANLREAFMSKALCRNKPGANIPQRRVSFERVQCVRLTSNLDRHVCVTELKKLPSRRADCRVRDSPDVVWDGQKTKWRCPRSWNASVRGNKETMLEGKVYERVCTVLSQTTVARGAGQWKSSCPQYVCQPVMHIICISWCGSNKYVIQSPTCTELKVSPKKISGKYKRGFQWRRLAVSALHK